MNDTSYPAFIREDGALAMGASTYEWRLRHVVKPGSADAAPWPYAQPAWVFIGPGFAERYAPSPA